MVTEKQVQKYRKQRAMGCSQELAALAAGISLKTGTRWEEGALPSTREKKPRNWRTRKDPLAAVWDCKVVPLLERDEHGVLQAKTIQEELRLEEAVLRTLQRRISGWRALHGPGKEVFFTQDHPPGHEAQLDFTHATELGVKIAGEPFAHLIFQLVLNYSTHREVSLAFGETTEALLEGIQNAFQAIGGVPSQVCQDNMSAASFELKGSAGREFTKRFKGFLQHYGMKGRRINAGESNENGVVERGNGVLKSALEQALAIRGSRDFETVHAYWQFVLEVVGRLNARCQERFEEEKAHLKPLPATRVPCYTELLLQVGKNSCINVANNIYSVPSRLIGYEVKVRRHPDEIEIIFRDVTTERIPRLRGRNHHRINYRHIIDSLVRKPGAFARYRFREDLFPSLTFRRAYDALVTFRGERADVEYVRILHLAAKTMESDVEMALNLLLEAGLPFAYAEVQTLAAPQPRPEQLLQGRGAEPDLASYDALLTEEMYASLCASN